MIAMILSMLFKTLDDDDEENVPNIFAKDDEEKEDPAVTKGKKRTNRLLR